MTDPFPDLRPIADRFTDEGDDPEALVAAARRRLEWRKRRGFKECSVCHRSLPVAEFGQDASRRDGLEHRCLTCRRVRRE